MMGGSASGDDIDAGVVPGLAVASEATAAVASANKLSLSISQRTPPGAVKPTTTSGSSGRRRLTSLSLRSAGYSDVEAANPTRSSGHVHLNNINNNSNKIPTPGSTMHTRSTSSFSSWSVGSLNAPREGSTKVPDIRTIVDLATGRAGRVTAAKVGPSPSGSVGKGTGFNTGSSRTAYPCSTPPGPHGTPARPFREPPDYPAARHRHRDSSTTHSADRPRIPISPLVSMAVMEQAAGLATKSGATTAPAAAAAHGKTADGGEERSKATNPTPPRCPVAAAPPRRKINSRRPGGVAAAAAASSSSRARRPPFNPYRVAPARRASPRHLDKARRQRGRQQRRRVKNEGTAAATAAPRRGRGRGRAHGEQLGGCSTLASSPSSSSSSPSSSSSDSCGNTDAVEWIWPAKGVGCWSPRGAARRRRATAAAGGVGGKPASSKSPPPLASRASSSPSAASSGSRRRVGFGVLAWSRNGAEAGGSDAGGGVWANPRHYSEARDDPASRPAARGDSAAAGAARREPTRSFSASTRGEAAEGGVAGRDGAVVPVREAFHPDGRGGWVGPPPRPLGAGDPAARAPHSASAGGEKNNGNAAEDICDLPPLLMRRRRVSVRRTAAAAGSQSRGNNKINRTAVAAVAPPPPPPPPGRLWKAVRRLFDGRGAGSPPAPPSSPPGMTQEENDSSFLNPFSPNSSRRFSTCSADAGAGDGYVSGYSGYESGGSEGGGGGGAAAAASRLTRQVFHPIADFNFEERVIGCIFGEEDGAASDDDVAHEGELGRKDQGEDEGQAGELTGPGENETNPAPFPPRPPPGAGLLPAKAWPPPAAAPSDGSSTADDIDDFGGDESTPAPAPAPTTAQSTIEDALALTKSAVASSSPAAAAAADPDFTRSSSTCSTTSSRSAVAVADANASSSPAASAATAAAVAGQDTLAASVAAVTAEQVRDALRFAVDPAVEAWGSEDDSSLVGGAE